MKITSSLIKAFVLISSVWTSISPSYGQSISPDVDSEVCPNTEYTFSVTIPGSYSSITTVGGCLVTQSPYNITTTSSTTSFNFKGKFQDANQTQTFQINYSTTAPQTFNATFKKIKSLFFQSQCTPIAPNQTNISAAICQAVNIPISFSNVQWSNSFATLCYGGITTYEYQLPVGWKVGSSFTSNGSNWYVGGNNVTVTSNLLGGNGSVIKVRPSNNCGVGLQNNSVPVNIGVTRANSPVLKLDGSSSVTLFCGDATAKTFTVQSPASCVTSYEWVTANKGWFDVNGNAITTNLITTNPSITIYPSCNSSNPAQDIEVLMKAGAEVLSSKVTITFSNTAPTIAINGSSEFCSSSTYTLPVSSACGATIEWSLQPLDNYPFPATLSCTNCNSTTLTKLNGGTALLRATVTFPNCNSTGIYEKYIGIGVPKFRGWYNSPTNSIEPLNPWTRQNPNSNPACYTTFINTTTDITANSTVIWSDAGNSGGVTWTQIGNNLRFYFSDLNQWAFFNVSISNSCGTTNLRYRFNSVGENCLGGPLLRVLVSPNPSSEFVNVELLEGEKVKINKEIRSIKLTDKNGNLIKSLDFSKDSKKINIDVRTLPVDVYNISVFDGKDWYTTRLFKN